MLAPWKENYDKSNILDINLSLYDLKIFHSVGCLFTLLIILFFLQSIYFDVDPFIYFAFVALAYRIIS